MSEKTMLAAVLEDFDQLVLQQVPIPEPGFGEVVVRIHSCGVCATDYKAIKGIRRNVSFPTIPGHEPSGVVAAVGKGVKHFFEGKADIEKFLSVDYRPLQPNIAEFQTWDKRIGAEGLVMALIYNATSLPGLWMSPDAFMLTCVDDFPLIRTLLEVASQRVNGYVATLGKLGVRAFRIAGAELCSQTLMGPRWFEKLCAPYDETLVDVIHKRGGTAFYHCHGRISAIIGPP